MTARRAPKSLASCASAPALRWAVTASTRNRSRALRTRSRVLEPIEPVAPSSVIDSSSARAAVLVWASGTTVIGSPQQQPLRGGVGSAANDPDQGCHAGGGKETIQAIHQPAVAGNNMARILDPEPALDAGFQEVATLGDDRQHECGRDR